ncbi:50S ribosomal protein L29 [Acetobacteraceae bacterium]|nr:50S ribosomal protein L29 [Acetobacteraceae bacterium]
MSKVKADSYKIEELRSKSIDELRGLLVELKKEQINQRFRLATSQQESAAEIAVVRKAVARIKLLLSEERKKNNNAAPKASAAQS